MGKKRRSRQRTRSIEQPNSSALSTSNENSQSFSRRSSRKRDRSKDDPSRDRLLLCGILIVTLVTFLNTLDGEFVYDDRYQIVHNPTIQTLANVPSLLTHSVWQFMNATTEQAMGMYYRPLFNVALAINYQLFGLQTFGWHAISVLLHLLATFLMYRLALAWGATSAVALAGALLFGLHPAHSESIAWISALPDPLALVLVLGSLLLYERHYHGREIGRWSVLTRSVILALLAMFTKELVIVLPSILVLREALDRREGEPLLAAAKRALLRTSWFWAATAAYLGTRYAVLGFLSRDDPRAAGFSAAQVLLTIPSVLLTYARILFFPYPLAFVYDNTYVSSPADPRFWIPLAVVISVIASVAWLVRRSMVGTLSLAWTILFLVPVLNLKAFYPEESLLHDRYLYFPSLGFCLLLAIGIDAVIGRFTSERRMVLEGTAVLIAVVFCLLTVQQNRTWHDWKNLASNAVSFFPHRPFIYNYIGVNYVEQGQITDAIEAYQQATRVRPSYSEAHYNLASLYTSGGKLDLAEQEYKQAIRHNPSYIEAHVNLAVLLTGQGRHDEALTHLMAAKRLNPLHPVMLYALGDLYMRTNRLQEAIEAFNRLAQHEPRHDVVHLALGLCYEQLGNVEQAKAHFEKAIEIAPAQPWTNTAREHLARLRGSQHA